MIQRTAKAPDRSFLLLGPRGTGKSTWLKQQIVPKLHIDLLNSTSYFELLHNPSSIRSQLQTLKPKDWVIIDEIQKIPALLDEVHWAYETLKIHFALSGSSARKLKKSGANLLAGRAIEQRMFPFIYPEIQKNWDLQTWVEWGSMPLIFQETKFRPNILTTYVQTYLRQELLEEGIVRKLEPFARFLQIAGIMNGQILNLENVARDSKVGRTTVNEYFQVLEDTLIGYRLPAYQGKIKVKEKTHPKFYFFDPGVARATASLAFDSVDNVWKGFAFETACLNEVRAYNYYHQKHRNLYYYAVQGGYEIDLIVEVKPQTLSQKAELILIEMKYSKKWDSKWSKPAIDFASQGKHKIKRMIGVYIGDKKLKNDHFEVLPIEDFLNDLHYGKIF